MPSCFLMHWTGIQMVDLKQRPTILIPNRLKSKLKKVWCWNILVIQIPTLTNFWLSGFQMVVWYSKGDLNTSLSLVQYSNGIQIPDHLAIGRVQLHSIMLNFFKFLSFFTGFAHAWYPNGCMYRCIYRVSEQFSGFDHACPDAIRVMHYFKASK